MRFATMKPNVPERETIAREINHYRYVILLPGCLGETSFG
jgi:hypothetical protein